MISVISVICFSVNLRCTLLCTKATYICTFVGSVSVVEAKAVAKNYLRNVATIIFFLFYQAVH